MGKVTTIYGDVEQSVFDQLKSVTLVAFDVDGIFSDGRIYLGNAGEEYKAFNTLDGYGIKALRTLGVKVAVITGRQSDIVENRMKSLGVDFILQGVEDKRTCLQDLMQQLNLTANNVASMGDDMPDIGMFELSSCRFSVPNGHPLVKSHANYVTATNGGAGAVREVCDLFLSAHGKLETLLGASI